MIYLVYKKVLSKYELALQTENENKAYKQETRFKRVGIPCMVTRVKEGYEILADPK